MKESMSFNWLRRTKQKETKPETSLNDSLNKQLETLTAEVTNLKRKVAELTKKSEEYEGTILKLRKESFELQTQNENLASEKEILKRTIKAFEQQLRKLRKKRRVGVS